METDKKIKVVIRPMKLSDVTQTKALNERCLAENYYREYWMEMYHKGKEHSFVAVFANLIIGYIFCSEDSVISFAVEEKYRGKHIGKQLMMNALNTFNNANKSVNLHARVSNENALGLYQNMGFGTKKIEPGYYINPPEDACLMTREPKKNNYTITKVLKIQL